MTEQGDFPINARDMGERRPRLPRGARVALSVLAGVAAPLGLLHPVAASAETGGKPPEYSFSLGKPVAGTSPDIVTVAGPKGELRVTINDPRVKDGIKTAVDDTLELLDLNDQEHVFRFGQVDLTATATPGDLDLDAKVFQGEGEDDGTPDVDLNLNIRETANNKLTLIERVRLFVNRKGRMITADAAQDQDMSSQDLRAVAGGLLGGDRYDLGDLTEAHDGSSIQGTANLRVHGLELPQKIVYHVDRDGQVDLSATESFYAPDVTFGPTGSPASTASASPRASDLPTVRPTPTDSPDQSDH